MSTLEPTTDKLIVQRGSDLFTTTVENMSTIQDDDLVLIGRGSDSYKITGKEFKEQSGGGTTLPPSIGGIELTSTGSGFSGNTFTTNLQNYSPGIPLASQTMKARVVGPLTLVGETSPIVNIDSTTVSRVRGYYSSTIPSNLAEAVSGTEFDMTLDGVNVVDNSHYLTLVCDPGCPTSGAVFDSDYGAIFDMKYSNGCGNFDADGTQLDAANNPPSGPSATTDVVFSDGGTTGYIVNTQAAYTIIKTIANSTLPAVSDAALATEPVLTLTDRQDLDNGMFEPGDVVQENVESGATKEWAGFVELTSASNSYDTGTPYLYPGGTYSSTASSLLAFDRNQLGDTYSLTFTFVAGANFFQTYTSTTSDGGWTQVVNSTQGPFTIDQDTTEYNRFVQIYGTGNGEFLYKIEGTANGKSVETVVSIDPSNPKMTVSGGTWNIGETVKNTVPHAPVITPETDEITAVSVSTDVAGDTWSNYLFTSDTDAYEPDATSTDFYAGRSALDSFDGDIYSWCGSADVGGGWLYWRPPVPITVESMRIYSDDTPGTIRFNGETTDYSWTDDVYWRIPDNPPAVVTEIAVQGYPGNVGRIATIEINGSYVIDGDPIPGAGLNVLTFAGTKDLVNFKAGDDVEQDSGYTPVTSAITGVTNNTAPDYTTTGTYAYGGDTWSDTQNGGFSADGSVVWQGRSNSTGVNNTYAAKYTFATPIEDVQKLEIEYVGSGAQTASTYIWTNNNDNQALNPLSSGSSYSKEDFTSTLNGSTTLNSISVTAPTGSYFYIRNIWVNDNKLIDNATSSALTLTDDKDLANFRVGDTVTGPSDQNDTGPWTGFFKSSNSFSTSWDDVNAIPISVTSGEEFTAYTYLKIDRTKLQPGDVIQLNKVKGANNLYITKSGTPDGAMGNQVITANAVIRPEGEDNSPTNLTGSYFSVYADGGADIVYNITGTMTSAVSATVMSVGPGDTMEVDDGTWNVGDVVTGPSFDAATGVVGSTDGSEMTLSSSDGRWMVNADKHVVGPTGPATEVTGYLKWENNKVTEVVNTDPGYLPAPPNLQLNFTDPAPTGDTWDEELPAGTTIATRVEATNEKGSANSGWSDPLTPTPQALSAEPNEAFIERALRLRTFTNRKHVYCGQQAEAKRDEAITRLVNAGYNLNEILKYL